MRKKLSAVSNQQSANSHQPSAISYQLSEAGFTLTELLITMVVFVLAIAAASQIFTGLLSQFKQQSKIAETNIEGVIGLEMLRQDLEHAGYGLPWNYSAALAGYSEADPSNVCGGTEADPADYNDSSSNPPRAVLSDNGTCLNGSDYLVIKAVNVARNEPSRKSTRLISTGVRIWTPADENLQQNDRVIVVRGSAGANARELVTSGAAFYTTYGLNGANLTPPTDPADNRIVYGIDPNTNPGMPFNRADYYISTANVPQRCAGGTGVFVKAAVNHGGGANILPLLDCVADMQVIYQLDTNDDGTIDTTINDIITVPLTHQQIREQVKEVRVYILAHEGQRDPNFTFNNVTCGAACITVGEFASGQDFDLSAITDWQNYRWKIYTIVVKPENLRGE